MKALKTSDLQKHVDELLTARQLSKMYKVTVMTVSLWRRHYGLPFVTIDNNFYYVPADVALWRASKKTLRSRDKAA